MLSAVLFDFDLTLADSSAGATDCANFALRALGFREVEQDVVRPIIGLPLPLVFKALSGSNDPAMARSFALRFIERADQVMAQLTLPFPSVPAVLTALRDRQLKLAIVSTKFRYRIVDILARANVLSLVDVIVGGEDVNAPKPDPTGIVTALDWLHIEPTQAIYVGDHVVDGAAARAAGLRFVGVLTGSTPRAALEAEGAVAVISSLDALEGLLLRI